MLYQKTLLYHCKNPGKKVLLLRNTGISAVNKSVTTIHPGLGIKPWSKLLGLKEESKAALKNELPEVIYLIIDELSTL